MSNSLAIATVTGVLGARIRAHMAAVGLTSDVTISHPLDAETHGAFLHLYNVLPNAGLRNETLPERSTDGTPKVAPRLALDLYYQLTFVGSATNYEPERMAGAVMTGLHAFPRLSPEEITDFVVAQSAGSPLLDSDLAEQTEHIRVTPLSSDIEELSRLWGMTQRPFHRLTVLYRVSPVLLDADVPTSRPLPVSAPAVTSFPFIPPRITSLVSSQRALPVVALGEELVVRGEALRAQHTTVVVGNHVLDPTSSSDSELRIVFDAASGLHPGIRPVQVRHLVELENGDLREGPRSNTVPVALVARVAPGSLSVTVIGGPDAAHDIHLVAEPMPAADQALELIVTGVGGAERATSTAWQTELGGTGLVFRFPPLAGGDYLVRLVVDDAESLLVTDPAGAFTGPVVTIP